VRAVFERYEAALARNDVAALNELFLPSANTVRFGIAEQQYGFEAIAAYRRAAAPVHPQRRLLRTVISAFGSDIACVSCNSPILRRRTWAGRCRPGCAPSRVGASPPHT